MSRGAADVCLLLEGTYPYTPGGVSSWIHDLVGSMPELSFHVVALLSGDSVPAERYQPPANVVAITPVFVRSLPPGPLPGRAAAGLFRMLEAPLTRLQEGQGDLRDITAIAGILRPHRGRIGERALLNSREAWNLAKRMYNRRHATCSFLDYFWTWRCLQEGLFSMMLADLPPARVYHTACTGYAGILAARAVTETGRPAILTEHGIYTNERRVEIAMADWLHETPPSTLDTSVAPPGIGDVWTRSFVSYSRACYAACDSVITLYQGNQAFQLADGAPAGRLRVIPNGIDVTRFGALVRDPGPRPPTIALIGRVVPIKDIKTFIRACALLVREVPDLRAWVMGPVDEDPVYAEECRAMTEQLGLENAVQFLGQVRLEDRLPMVDVIVLTSISEAQPLVILEAGAAGIPCVSTDVGSCRELILGRAGESPAFGHGGEVTPLANPAATARALARLLRDPAWHASCGGALRGRVGAHYRKADILHAYLELYRTAAAKPARDPEPEAPSWPA